MVLLYSDKSDFAADVTHFLFAVFRLLILVPVKEIIFSYLGIYGIADQYKVSSFI